MAGGFDVFQLMNGLEICNVTSDSKHYSSFSCGLCKKLVSLDCIVTSRCNHVFCRRCLEGHVITQTFLQQTGSKNAGCSCPKCQTDITSDSIGGSMAIASIQVGAKPLQESQPLAFQVLQLVQVRCLHGSRCMWCGDYGGFLKHMASHVGDQSQPSAQYLQQNTPKAKPASPICMESDPSRDKDKHGNVMSAHQQAQDSKMPSNIRRDNGHIESTGEAHFSENSNDADLSLIMTVPREIIVEARRNNDRSEREIRRDSVSTLHFDDDFHDSNPKYLSQTSQSRDTDGAYGVGGDQETPGTKKTIPQSSVILEGAENQASSLYVQGPYGNLNNRGANVSDKKTTTPRTLDTEAESQDLQEQPLHEPQSPESGDGSSSAKHQVLSRWNDTNANQFPQRDREHHFTRNTSLSSNTHSHKQQTHSATILSKKQGSTRSSSSLGYDDEYHSGPVEYDMDSPEIQRPVRTKKEILGASINSLGQWDGNGEDDATTNTPSRRGGRDEDSDLMAEEEKYNRIIEKADKLKKQANAKFNKDKFEEARQLYTESINLMNEIRPSSADDFKQLSNMHSNRAVTYFREGEYYKCIKDCDKALGYEPTYDKSWIRKWRALMALGNFNDAYSCLEEANAKIPFSKKIVTEFKKVKSDKHILTEAQDLFSRGELAAGKDYLRKHIMVCDNITMLCLAARIDISLGDKAEALEKVKKALQINPLQEDANELNSFAHFTSGDSDAAVSLLNEAYRKNKDSKILKEASSRFQKAHDSLLRGRSEIKNCMYEAAAESFSIAIKESMPLPPLCQMFAALRKERAEAYMLSRNFIQALKDCQEVLTVQRTYVPICLLRSEILILLGKTEEAKKELYLAKKTWGADDPYIDDGYYRADFETRIIHVNNDITKFMRNLQVGVFDIDNPTAAAERNPVSPEKKSVTRTPKPKQKQQNRRTTLSHIEARGFGAENVPFSRPIEDYKKIKDPRRKKSSDKSSDDIVISKSYGLKHDVEPVPPSPNPSLGRRRDKKRDENVQRSVQRRASNRSTDESLTESLTSNSKQKDRGKHGTSIPKADRGLVQRTVSDSGDRFLVTKRRDG